MSFDEGDDPREVGAKGPDAFRTISEVADDLGLPQHVLRFWETRFPQIKPIKRGGGRRYYRPGDVELLRGVKELLYGQGYTIRGVQRILREQGGRKLAQTAGQAAPIEPPSDPEFFAPRRSAPADDLFDDDEPTEEAAPVERPAPPIAEPTPAPVVEVSKPSPSQPGLSESQTRRLASALDELNACRRLLGGLA